MVAGSIPTVGLAVRELASAQLQRTIVVALSIPTVKYTKAQTLAVTGFSPDISSGLLSAGPAIRWSTGICFGYLLFALSPQFRSSQRSLQCGRGFHLSAAKAVCFEDLSGRLFECERRQRLSFAAHPFVQPSGMVKETLETTADITPRPLDFGERSSPTGFIEKGCFCRHPQVGHHNIELSRPAVRSPVATQFTVPIPHYKPARPRVGFNDLL